MIQMITARRHVAINVTQAFDGGRQPAAQFILSHRVSSSFPTGRKVLRTESHVQLSHVEFLASYEIA